MTAMQASDSAGFSAAETPAILQEAYVYLYPLILMDLTRRQMTATGAGASPISGPPNAFTHIRAFPDSDMRVVVRPNFDTLYSSAWLDLTGGPVVVSTKDTGGRYFLLPMLDMWTDVFAVPGKRTNGTAGASFAVIPPGWSGDLPADAAPIHAPTPYVWIIGRTQTNGPADYPAVHAVQDGYTIAKLPGSRASSAAAQAPIDLGVDASAEPLRQIAAMPADRYFAYGMQLMAKHPPHVTDWSLLARMKRIGLEPGKSVGSGIGRDELARAAAAAAALMQEKMPTLARVVNGWQMNTDTMGVYGDYYLKRAIVAMAGLGANQPEDAIYPLNVCDADGRPVVADANY
ncbi:MAG TPA: DUF1254 domain-containing protein, partial [Candidatus Tumulicola sp.]|nr:DUF1254 domain-containing protein [Candidatus Tumulicola sp.]